MKKLVTLLLLGCSSIVRAQDETPPIVQMPIDSTTGRVRFQEVVNLDKSMSASTIIQATRKWVAQSYKDANKVVQQYDPDGGLLIGKGNFPMVVDLLTRPNSTQSTVTRYNADHTLTVEAKDGRCRITLEGFALRADLPPSPYVTPAMSEAVPFDPRGCSVDRDAYRSIAQEEMKRLGYTGKMYQNAIDKSLANSLSNARRICESLKKEAQNTIGSLKQSLQKSATDSKW